MVNGLFLVCDPITFYRFYKKTPSTFYIEHVDRIVTEDHCNAHQERSAVMTDSNYISLPQIRRGEPEWPGIWAQSGPERNSTRSDSSGARGQGSSDRNLRGMLERYAVVKFASYWLLVPIFTLFCIIKLHQTNTHKSRTQSASVSAEFAVSSMIDIPCNSIICYRTFTYI